MRAISLWQPWASAVAVNAKRIETRHWSTPYRGPLAIHAAKRKNVNELIHYHSHWSWQGALRAAGWNWGRHDREFIRGGFGLPFGAIVAVCELTDCLPTGSFTQEELDTPRRPGDTKADAYDWTERQMGDFTLGRFGWVLTNIRRIERPIPFKGGQGFFNVPDDLINDALLPVT